MQSQAKMIHGQKESSEEKSSDQNNVISVGFQHGARALTEAAAEKAACSTGGYSDSVAELPPEKIPNIVERTGYNTLTTIKSSQSDKQLVKRAQAGDKRAFDLLVIKYQSRIATIVGRYVSDRHEVQDVTQEAFIKAYRSLKGFRGDSAFYTWVYRIATNTAKNYLVAKGRRPMLSDLESDELEQAAMDSRLKDIDSPDQLMHSSQVAKELQRVWRQMPEELGIALTLRENNGLSYDEIAEVMDCPVGTVRSRIFRAREVIDTKIGPLLVG